MREDLRSAAKSKSKKGQDAQEKKDWSHPHRNYFRDGSCRPFLCVRPAGRTLEFGYY
jgi:hypothetical protein